MKNHWLDKRNSGRDWQAVRSVLFETAIEEYRLQKMYADSPPDGWEDAGDGLAEARERLAGFFRTITRNIVSVMRFDFVLPPGIPDLIEDCVRLCFEKQARYDTDKRVAFNYFTTTVLGHLRQLHFAARNGVRRQGRSTRGA